MTEREIFFEALEMATPEARAALLQGACGQDVTLRHKVDELLKEHFSNDSLLAGSALEGERPTIAVSPVPEAPAQMIGRYKLLGENRRRRLRRGLYGRAGRAGAPPRRAQGHQAGHGHQERNHPLRGRAPGAGADGPSEHREGVRCGATEAHRPTGESQRDSRPPSPVRRFPPAAAPTSSWNWCVASRSPSIVTKPTFHARPARLVHQSLPGHPARAPEGHHPPRHQTVEHPRDAARRVPVPKVIDFGIAKATTDQLTDKTLFTAFEQFIGTPAYMSPEQAEMSGLRHRYPQRHLQPGRAALRNAHGQDAVQCERTAGLRTRRDAPHDPGGGTRAPEHQTQPNACSSEREFAQIFR